MHESRRQPTPPAPPTRCAAAAELRAFAATVYRPGDTIELRLIRDPRRPGGRPDVRRAWHDAADLPGLAGELRRADAAGFNVFAGVNPRRGRGAAGDAAVVLARVLFADFDGCAIGEAARRVRAAALPTPDLLIGSGGGVHAYWRLAGATGDLDAWRGVMRRLARALDADAAVANAERVMRLPGFTNHKAKYADAVKGPPRCRIVAAQPGEPGAWLALGEFADLLPRPSTPKPRTRSAGMTFGAERVRRAARYVAKMPPAISGSGGHDATFAAACVLFRFGLTRGEAADLLDGFNGRCDPPWSERELAHKLDDAARKVAAAGEAGALLDPIAGRAARLSRYRRDQKGAA